MYYRAYFFQTLCGILTHSVVFGPSKGFPNVWKICQNSSCLTFSSFRKRILKGNDKFLIVLFFPCITIVHNKQNQKTGFLFSHHLLLCCFVIIWVCLTLWSLDLTAGLIIPFCILFLFCFFSSSITFNGQFF